MQIKQSVRDRNTQPSLETEFQILPQLSAGCEAHKSLVGHQNAACEEKSSVCLQDGSVRRLRSTNID
jgi:hypothetical protein